MTEEKAEETMMTCEWKDCNGETYDVDPQPAGHWRYYRKCTTCGKISCEPLSITKLGYAKLMRDMMTLVHEELPLPEKYNDNAGM